MQVNRKITIFIAAVMVISFLAMSLTALAEKYAVATTGIRVNLHYLMGPISIDMTVGAKLPPYLVPGSIVNAEYFYERNDCVTNGGSVSVHVILYVDKEKIELGNIRVPLGCGAAKEDHGEFKAIIPSIPVNGLKMGKLCLEVGAVSISGPTADAKQLNNVCGTVYITDKEPVFNVKVVIPGNYLDLGVGEHKVVELHITTTVPAEVEEIDISGNIHSSVTFMGSTPLLLEPGRDNVLRFDIAGVSSGTDIIAIIIKYTSYYKGELSAYVPIIVMGNDIQQEINKLKSYEEQVEQIRSRILSEINEIIGSTQGINNIQSLLETLSSRYNMLETRCSEVAKQQQLLGQEIAAINNEMKLLKNNIANLDTQIKEAEYRVKTVEANCSFVANQSNTLKQRIAAIEKELSSLENKVTELESKIKELENKMNQSQLATINILNVTQTRQVTNKTRSKSSPSLSITNNFSETTGTMPNKFNKIIGLLALTIAAILIYHSIIRTSKR